MKLLKIELVQLNSSNIWNHQYEIHVFQGKKSMIICAEYPSWNLVLYGNYRIYQHFYN